MIMTIRDRCQRTRVSIAIQFTSQFLPPSSENACSKRQEFAVISDTTYVAEPLSGRDRRDSFVVQVPRSLRPDG
jgi:hypothetical protein